MPGAIIGDIVGSRFEWNNIRSKQFDFLTHKCFFTDDSVMSLAVAKAILECGQLNQLREHAIRCMQEVGRPYDYRFDRFRVFKGCASALPVSTP